MGIPSSVWRMVPSVEPGTPPYRGAFPVTFLTAKPSARTTGSSRATFVGRRSAPSGSHSALIPGWADSTPRQSPSISRWTASSPMPGVSLTSRISSLAAGMTFAWGRPWTGAWSTVGVTVGGSRYRLRLAPRLSRRWSAGTSRRRVPIGGMGLAPAWGMAPWAILPRMRTRAQTTPRCSKQSSFCSGSQMIAAWSCLPIGLWQRWRTPSMAPSSSASAPTINLPGSASPARVKAAAAIIAAASPPFMSAAPRP